MSDSLIARFRRFAADSSSDELAGALLVNEVLDPGLDAGSVRARLDALADGCPEDALPWTYLGDRGYAGNRNDTIDTANSCIAEVLETRRGIPISLGVLLVHVARRLGYEALGINFPGHFLARVDGVLVDPFAFQTVTEEDCLKGLKGGRTGRTFEIASSSMIALRMLNNIKYQFMGMARWDRVLDVVDCQLAVSPEAAQLLAEQGRAWEELGAPDVAERIYSDLLQAPNADEVRDTVEARLKQLQRGPATWH